MSLTTSMLAFIQKIKVCNYIGKNKLFMIIMNSIGNVTNVSVQYDRTSQTITCTSTGGPATDVTWSKDNVNIRLTMGGLYEHSQIITNTTSATYENRLRIVDKSSEAAGNYICSITNPRGGMNESLYIQGNYYA